MKNTFVADSYISSMRSERESTLSEVQSSGSEVQSLGKTVAIVALLGVCLTLNACSRNRVIATTDDSAEYKSARSLPPLKKPDRVAEPVTPAVDSAPVPVEVETLAETITERDPIENVVDESAIEDVAVVDNVVEEISEPVAQEVETSQPESQEPLVAEPLATQAIEQDVAIKSPTSVNAKIDNNGNASVLTIDANFDTAWDYLTKQLTSSNVTVFSRNKSAGRIAIGCAEIGNDAGSEVKRAGGWSIFSGRKTRASEYCALRAVERRGETVVSVYDRAGQLAPASPSELILERVLSN